MPLPTMPGAGGPSKEDSVDDPFSRENLSAVGKPNNEPAAPAPQAPEAPSIMPEVPQLDEQADQEALAGAKKTLDTEAPPEQGDVLLKPEDVNMDQEAPEVDPGVQTEQGMPSGVRPQGDDPAAVPQPAVIPEEGNEKPRASDLQTLKPDEQVEFLLKMAKDHGLTRAIALARGTQDPYVIDRLHDVLVNELRESQQASPNSGNEV